MIYNLFVLTLSLAGAVEGEFSYNGQYAVASSIRFETVYPASEVGKVRLAELQNEGYSCQSKLQFIQCHKLSESTAGLPSELSKTLPSVETVTFGPVQAMDLISQGEDLAQFEAVQDVNVDGVAYSKVNYLESSDLVKATVGNPSDSSNYHSFIVNPDSVSVLDSIAKTESKWVYNVYHVEFFLVKK